LKKISAIIIIFCLVIIVVMSPLESSVYQFGYICCLLIHQLNYSFSVLTILARNFVFADVADFTNIALLYVAEYASYLDQLVRGVTSVIAVNVVCNLDDT
jgi:hypothetical protein